MTTVEALIRVKDTESGWILAKTFAASPIRVGRDRTNGVRLQHPTIATFHGEIAFGPTFLAFRNLSRTLNASVDGTEVPPLTAVPIKEQSVIALGPFRIEIGVRPISVARVEPANDVAALLAPRADRLNGHHHDRGTNGVGLGLGLELYPASPRHRLAVTSPASMAGRAAGMLALFAAGFLRLERHLMPPGSAPLLLPGGPTDLVEYLLDPVLHSATLLEQFGEALDTLVASAARITSADRVVQE